MRASQYHLYIPVSAEVVSFILQLEDLDRILIAEIGLDDTSIILEYV